MLEINQGFENKRRIVISRSKLLAAEARYS